MPLAVEKQSDQRDPFRLCISCWNLHLISLFTPLASAASGRYLTA